MFFKTKFPSGKYSELNPRHIISTLEEVIQRIGGTFPGSGLGKVATELKEVGKCAIQLVKELRHPLWSLRILTITAIVSLITFAIWLSILTIRVSTSLKDGLMETLQGVESATNEVILLAIGILFFATLETRMKRKKAFESLHRLRSIAHVVDMHQLTKDPNNLLSGTVTASSSPGRSMTPYELTRYLDYCTELLAITSKLAALHVQYFQDKEVLKIVNEVEMLAHELSNKIWQKIMILDIKSPDADKPMGGNENENENKN
ncbi:MAG TPA: hypothetical protein ENJ95_17570 [Bacteroidetes bacterium]|nr:hypothetical protein [Bacteroidota bacterium]